MSSKFAAVLVGDSDIERWPKDLYPDAAWHGTSGRSGATLGECVPLVPDVVYQGLKASASRVFVIACAGENDISQSLSLDESCSALHQFLSTVFATEQHRIHLVFLGPKFEPWLNNDKESRLDYIRMSRAFEKICIEHALAGNISFLDCLVMFCGESGNSRGALLGGNAKAEAQYFDYDLLHLNRRGYGVWKQAIDKCIEGVTQSRA